MSAVPLPNLPVQRDARTAAEVADLRTIGHRNQQSVWGIMRRSRLRDTPGHLLRHVAALVVLPLILLLLVVGDTAAQNDSETAADTDPTAAPAAVDPLLASKLESPRATMLNFLRTVNADERVEVPAIDYLDVSAYDAETLRAKGNDFVLKLKGLIDRMWLVDPAEISDDPDSDQTFVLGDYAEGLTSTADKLDADLIRITRGEDGLWRFDQVTVAAIEDLWVRWDNRPLVEGLSIDKTKTTLSMELEHQLPSWLRRTTFLMPNWHWCSLVLLVFLGFAFDIITRVILNTLTNAWFRKYKPGQKFKAPRNMWKPVGLLAQASTWYFGAGIIGFRAEVVTILMVTLKLFTVVAAVWSAFRVIDILVAYFLKKAGATHTKFDDLLIPLIGKSMKTLAVCIGIILFVDVFDLEWRAILGGFGIGGAAIAFASKDVISNFFGSLTVLTDRPFEIGDWVITEGVEGSVETVGIRSSRIRTFYNSMVVVPNSLLTTAIVDNMGKRQFRRIKTMLGVQYDTTPDQIEAFCEGIRELIRRHPYTRKDYYHVYFNEFSDSSLNILLYCFLECPDWSVELREKQRLFLDIMRLARELNVSFAFPTQTLHMFQEDQSGDHANQISDAESTGRRIASGIAGPPLTADRRPGLVEFPGPSDIDDAQ